MLKLRYFLSLSHASPFSFAFYSDGSTTTTPYYALPLLTSPHHCLPPVGTTRATIKHLEQLYNSSSSSNPAAAGALYLRAAVLVVVLVVILASSNHLALLWPAPSITNSTPSTTTSKGSPPWPKISYD